MRLIPLTAAALILFTCEPATAQNWRDSLQSELPGFREAAAKLYVPAPDPRTGVIEQFDGYHELQENARASPQARRPTRPRPAPMR